MRPRPLGFALMMMIIQCFIPLSRAWLKAAAQLLPVARLGSEKGGTWRQWCCSVWGCRLALCSVT